MAELSITIGAEIKDLLRKLKITEAEFQKLAIEAIKTGRSIGSVLKKLEKDAGKLPKAIDESSEAFKELESESKKTTKVVTGGFTKSSSSARNLRGGVEGVVREMFNVQKGAVAGGKALRTALIGTGIGLLIIALGLVVEHWDKIFAGIDKANKALLKQRHIIETTLGLRDARLALVRAERLLLEATGGDTSKLISREKKLLQLQIDKNKDLIENKKRLKAIIVAEQKRISLLEDLGNVIGKSPFSQKEIDKINEYTKEIDQAKTSVAGLQTELFNLNNPDVIDLTVDLGTLKKKAFKGLEGFFTKSELRFQKLTKDIANKTQKAFEKIEPAELEFKVANLDFFRETAERVNNLKRLAKRLDVDFVLSGRSDRELDEAENRLLGIRDIQRLLNREGIDIEINFSGMDSSEIDTMLQKLENASIQADVLSRGIGRSFSALGHEIAQGLQTGNTAIDSFVGSVISSLTALLGQMLAQAIAQQAIGATALASEAVVGLGRQAIAGTTAQVQGVQIATAGATALGPLGFVALAPMLATTQALIAGSLALAKAGSFAVGGFTGAGAGRDSTGQKVAGIVHDGEYVVPKKVLKTKKGASLVSLLEGMRTSNTSNESTVTNDFSNSIKNFASGGFASGNVAFLNRQDIVLRPQELSSITNNTSSGNALTDGIVGEVILRGSTQVIQFRRAEKKMNRYFNS